MHAVFSCSTRTLARSAHTINSRAVSTLLTLGLLLGTATVARAQVFLAAQPTPQFTIGPLIVGTSVPRGLGAVQMNVSWSLSVPAGGRLPAGDDLFLLWPRAGGRSCIAAPS